MADADKDNDEAAPMEPMRIELAYRPPYDWDAMLRFLDARAIAGVERIEPGFYYRTLAVAGSDGLRTGWLSVHHAPRRHVLRVQLSASLAHIEALVLPRVRHAFDVDCDPAPILATLGALARSRPGLRVPRTCDGFELAVRAIVGQQVSVTGARTLLGRLVRAFGTPLEDEQGALGLSRLFPPAQALAAQGCNELQAIGLTTSRARTLRDLACAVASGDIALHPGTDAEKTCRALQAVRGIGPWTSAYVAMRALGCSDAFPDSDLGVLHALRETRPAAARRRSEAWRPWRAYAVMHLWQ